MTNHVISRVKKGIYPDHFGLANQLFQIATVCAYAKRNGLVAAFPDLRNTERNGPYLETVFRNVDTGHDDRVAFCMNEGRVYYEPTFKYTEIPAGMSDFLVDGYFQSEQYFSDCSGDIREMFAVDPGTKEKILEKTKGVSEWATLHIRRGDYSNFPDVFVDLCSTDYYKNALSHVESSIVYIVTNDVEWSKEWVSENLAETGFEFRWTDENEIFDLYLMSMAKECIIANSSFSWWGSWLGENKKTIAPRNWFCEEHREYTASDIYHSNCTIINTDIE